MIRSIRTLGAIAAFALLSFSFAQAADSSDASVATAAIDPVNVVASNWKFTPSAITLKEGRPVILHLTSTEGVHGLQSDDLGLPMTTIMPGKGVDVKITPSKTGTFVLPCEVFCGAGHADMKLTVKVVP